MSKATAFARSVCSGFRGPKAKCVKVDMLYRVFDE